MAATLATYCPSGMVEHPKSSQPNPGSPGDGPPCRLCRTFRAAIFWAARCGDLVLTAAADSVAERGGHADVAAPVAASCCCCSNDSALRTGRRTWFGMSWIDGFWNGRKINYRFNSMTKYFRIYQPEFTNLQMHSYRLSEACVNRHIKYRARSRNQEPSFFIIALLFKRLCSDILRGICRI